MTPAEALKAVQEHKSVECTAEEWPQIRPHFHMLVRSHMTSRNPDAVLVLMEIKRQDAKHRFKI